MKAARQAKVAKPQTAARTDSFRSSFSKLFGLVYWGLVSVCGLFLLLVAAAVASVYVLNEHAAYRHAALSYLQQFLPPQIDLADARLTWRPGELLLQLEALEWQQAAVHLHAEHSALRLRPAALWREGYPLQLLLQGGELVIDAAKLQPAAGGLTNDNQLITRLLSGEPLYSTLDLDLRIEDLVVNLVGRAEPLVTIERQLVSLRQTAGMQLTSQFSLGAAATAAHLVAAQPRGEFTLSFNQRRPAHPLYVSFAELRFEKTWQTELAPLLPAQLQEALTSLVRLEGTGEVWLTRDLAGATGDLVVKTRLNLAELRLENLGEELHDFSLRDAYFTGSFAHSPATDSWQLYIADTALVLEGALPATPRLSFEQLAISSSPAALSILSPQLEFATASLVARQVLRNAQIVNDIKRFNPRGQLHNLELIVKAKTEPEPRFMLNGELVDVTTTAVNNTPGMINASGALVLRDQRGWFFLDDEYSYLSLPKLYYEPFGWSYAKGSFSWEWQAPNTLLLVGQAYDIRDGAMRAAMQLSVHSVPHEYGYMDLEVGVRDANLAQSRSFIPFANLANRSAEWLAAAIQGGESVSAAISIRMNTREPEHPQTVFDLVVHGEEPLLQYRAERPPLTAANFSLYMNTELVEVSLPGTTLVGGIANLSSSYGVVALDTGQFLLGGTGDIYLEQLPSLIADYLFELDEEDIPVVLAGSATGEWDVRYDLQQGALLSTYFDLNLAEVAVINREDPAEQLTALTGSWGLSPEGFSGEWSADYQGERIAGRFIADEQGRGVQLSGRLKAPASLAAYAAGSAAGTLTLYIKERPGGANKYTAADYAKLYISNYELAAELQGLQLQLPYPLAKERAAAVSLLAVGDFDAEQHKLLLGDEFALRLNLGITATALAEVQLDLRGLEAELSPRAKQVYYRRAAPASIKVRAQELPQPLDLDAWQEFLAAVAPELLEQAGVGPDGNIIDQLKDLYSRVKHQREHFPAWEVALADTKFGGQLYAQAELRQVNPNYWTFAVATPSGHSARGSILPDWQADLLEFELAELAIASSETAANSSVLEGPAGGLLAPLNLTNSARNSFLDYLPERLPAAQTFTGLPAVRLHINEINYNNLSLGEIRASLSPTPARLSLVVAESTLFGLQLAATADWTLATAARGDVELAVKLGGDLQAEIFDNVVARDLDFSLRWQWAGEFAEFDNWYETATGELILSSGSGYLVSDNVNILLNVVGLFNLDNLRSHLAGDFSHLSSTRLAYRDAYLVMNLENGNYVTQEQANLNLAAMKLNAEGSYNLREDDLDLAVRATAPTTRTLPLVALVLGASSILPVLMAVDSGGDFINRLSSAVYRLEGPLRAPESTLAGVSDLNDRRLEPEDLANQLQLRGRFDNFRF